MTDNRITDNQLLVEVVRRCRVRQIPNITYTAFAAATPVAVIGALGGLMDRHAIRSSLNNLIADGTMCVTCRLLTFREGIPANSTVSGLLRQYHPELPFDSYQHFSPAGIPKPRGQKRVPGSTSLLIRGLYVTADGLPVAVQKLLEKEQYIYPA